MALPSGMTAEQYAAEIKRKLSDPNATWTNRQAATDWMKQNPQYFQSTGGAPSGTQTTTTQAPRFDYRTDYLGQIYKDERPVDFSHPATMQALRADPAAAEALRQRESILASLSAPARLRSQEQVQDLLSKLLSRAEEPFTYNPEEDPVYKAILPRVQQDVMEQLNQRGILSSTMTGENLARVTSGIIPALAEQAYSRYQQQFGNLGTVLNALMGLESQQYERARQAEQDRLTAQSAQLEAQQRQLDNAWNRVKMLGYVDNTASVILGLPVGTRSFEAQNAYEDRALRLQLAREDNAAAMARTLASGGGSDIPKTAGERAALATSTLFNAGVQRFNELSNAGYKYPLYYAVSSILRDPEWVSAARTSGADIKTAIDDLIRSVGGMTPEEFFKTSQGAKLKSYYDSLVKQTNDAMKWQAISALAGM